LSTSALLFVNSNGLTRNDFNSSGTILLVIDKFTIYVIGLNRTVAAFLTNRVGITSNLVLFE